MLSTLNRIQIRGEGKRAGHHLWMGRSRAHNLAYHLGIAALLLLATWSASAQEALQNSLAGDAATTARGKQMQSPDYTIKDGDFQMLVLPSLGLDWNDNINLSQTNLMDDYI